MQVEKKWFQSKTLWFFALYLVMSVAALFGFGAYAPSPDQQEIVSIVVAVIGMVLRLISNSKIVS